MLADSDEALELFANTVREQHATDVKVVPITSARRWRQWKVVLPVAAAAALAVVMVPRLAGPAKHGDLANEYAMELTQDPRFAGGLRDGWEQRGWAVTRGGTRARGTSGAPKVESRLAFRLGVRTVDLQVALRRGDTALAGRLTNELLETLKAVVFSDLVGASYAELKSRLATDPVARSIERASDAERELADLLGSPSFAFGQWVGAADVAAQTHDASFLRVESWNALHPIDDARGQPCRRRRGGASTHRHAHESEWRSKRPRARRRARDTSDSHSTSRQLRAGYSRDVKADNRGPRGKTPFPVSADSARRRSGDQRDGALRYYLRPADALESESLARLAKIVGPSPDAGAPHRRIRVCAMPDRFVRERLVRGLLAMDRRRRRGPPPTG